MTWQHARRLASLVALAAALTCCTRSEPEAGSAHDDDHAHDGARRGAHAHEDDLTRVHVAEDMLRDLHLSTQRTEVRAAGEAVSVLGELRVNEARYAEVGAAIEARVARVLAAPGDRVEAGQPLVELESLEIARARAALASAEARLQLAQQSAERKRALSAEQIATTREREAAEAELTQALAERRAAEEALGSLGALRGKGARFALTAPLAGTVLERNALPGRRVDPKGALFVVADLSTLWLVVHAFERDALRVHEGAEAQLSFAALPGVPFTGKVVRTGTQVDPVSRTIDVRIDVDNPDGRLRPGMSATARIALGDARTQVITVPTHAVQRAFGSWVVFLPTGEQGAYEVRKVGRGRDLDGEVEIVSGLSAGDEVVVDGAFLLKAQVERARGGGEEHHH